MDSSVFDIHAGNRQIRFSPEMLENLLKAGSVSAAKLDAYLLIRDGKRWGNVHRLVSGEMPTMGRVASNEIVIQDGRCSRKHCALYQQGEQWFIRDLGSRNGTRLNGEKISVAMPLKSGDWIRIGKTKILFTHDLSATGEVADSDSQAS